MGGGEVDNVVWWEWMIIAESHCYIRSKVKVGLVLGKCKTICVTCVTHGTDRGRHLGAVTSDKGCKGTNGLVSINAV